MSDIRVFRDLSGAVLQKYDFSVTIFCKEGFATGSLVGMVLSIVVFLWYTRALMQWKGLIKFYRMRSCY